MYIGIYCKESSPIYRVIRSHTNVTTRGLLSNETSSLALLQRPNHSPKSYILIGYGHPLLSITQRKLHIRQTHILLSTNSYTYYSLNFCYQNSTETWPRHPLTNLLPRFPLILRCYRLFLSRRFHQPLLRMSLMDSQARRLMQPSIRLSDESEPPKTRPSLERTTDWTKPTGRYGDID